MIGWATVIGLGFGLLAWGVNLIGIVDNWSRGYTGMFGPLFPVVVTLVIVVGAGTVAGLFVGLALVGVRRILGHARAR